MKEFREAIDRSEVVEDYPHGKYGPSMSGISAFTLSDRPIHFHCRYPVRPIIKIITLYEPYPSKWINCPDNETGRFLKTPYGTRKLVERKR